MDDSQQKQPITSPVGQSQLVTQPVNTPVQDSVKNDDSKQTILPSPISTPSRESDPGFFHTSENLIEPSAQEKEVSIPTEVQELGIETVNESPKLTEEDTQAGIVHSPGSGPVPTGTTTTVALPMTQQQAQQTVKLHKKVKDSLFWLAMLIMRQWQMANKKKQH